MALKRKSIDQLFTQMIDAHKERRAHKEESDRFTERGTARVRVQPNGARYVRVEDLIASPKFRETIEELSRTELIREQRSDN